MPTPLPVAVVVGALLLLLGVGRGGAPTLVAGGDGALVGSGVADTGVVGSGVAGSGVTDEGVADTGVTGTGVTGSVVVTPGVVASDVAASGVASSGVMAGDIPNGGSPKGLSDTVGSTRRTNLGGSIGVVKKSAISCSKTLQRKKVSATTAAVKAAAICGSISLGLHNIYPSRTMPTGSANIVDAGAEPSQTANADHEE